MLGSASFDLSLPSGWKQYNARQFERKTIKGRFVET